MTTTRKKRPRDPVQFTKLIGDIATGQTPDAEDVGMDEAAARRGRAGSTVGGPARADRVNPERRTQIAREAAAKL